MRTRTQSRTLTIESVWNGHDSIKKRVSVSGFGFEYFPETATKHKICREIRSLYGFGLWVRLKVVER